MAMSRTREIGSNNGGTFGAKRKMPNPIGERMQSGNCQTTQRLIKDLASARFGVKERAISQLIRAGESAVPALMASARSQKEDLCVRRNVIYILGRIGAGATGAVETLKYLQERDSHVSTVAETALISIRKREIGRMDADARRTFTGNASAN